jgi:hypothetical protein
MGNIVRVHVRLRGIRPLIQKPFGRSAIPLPGEQEEKTGVAGNDPEEWRRAKMVTADGQLYIKSSYVFACLRDAAKHTKKGRGSIQPLVAATLQVEETIILLNRRMPETGDPPVDVPDAPVYIDVAGVRNPATKGRNVRYRLACSPGWECEFTIRWDKLLVTREQMKSVLKDASILVGLGDGRSIGNGRFLVTMWQELSQEQEASQDVLANVNVSVPTSEKEQTSEEETEPEKAPVGKKRTRKKVTIGETNGDSDLDL